MRTDLITTPLTQWADLWKPQIAGNIALYRGQPREVIALALRSLGHSANTENPAELEAALAKLIELKPRVIFPEERGLISPAKLLISGEVAVAMGYAFDVLESRAAVPAIQYALRPTARCCGARILSFRPTAPSARPPKSFELRVAARNQR